MKDIVYTSKGAKVQNVYRDKHRMIVRPGAVFPDVCIGCGKPSWGNTIHSEFSGFGWWLMLPPVLDVLAHFIFDDKRYHFDFPFCPSCSPNRLQLTKVRLDSHLAIFVAHIGGFPSTLIDALPPVPPDVVVEENRTWLQRTFRSRHG